jgi:DNA-binding beta-propeller fold protein YncE
MLVDVLTLDAPPAPGLGSGAVAVAKGLAYVANWTTRNVSIISGDAVQTVLPLNGSPGAMVADPGSSRVFVLSEEQSAITVIEGEVVSATWKIEDRPYRAALAGGGLWVGSLYSGVITVVSTVDGRVLQRFALPEAPVIHDLIATPDGAYAYIATSRGLYRLDANTPEITAYAPSDYHRAMALSADGRALYVARYDGALGQAVIEVRDAATLAVTGQLPAAPDLSALLADPRTGLLYALSQLTGELLTIDPATRAIVEQRVVGYEPVAMALDAAAGLLYIVNREGASVAVVDTSGHQLDATVPLTALVTGLTVHPTDGTLYVALSSADQVLALREGGARDAWRVHPYPTDLAYIASINRLAVLSYAQREVALLDDAGAIAASYAVGFRPVGLSINAIHRRIYAGETIIDWHTGITSTWRVPGLTLGSESPPQQIVVDTRRDIAYAVAFNGIPGSNGGSIMARWNGQAFETAGPMPGKLSVIEAIYDDKMDRFYVTHSRMGISGLQVSSADDSAEMADIALERYPVAMALNPNTWRLWVALPTYGEAEPPHTRLRAYDTRSLSPAVEIEVADRVGAIAVDVQRNRVYAASQHTGRIYVVQDVSLPAPPQAQTIPTPTLTPLATAAPQPLPSITPSAPPLTPTGKPQTFVCVGEADARLRPAWQSLGADAGMGCAYTSVEEGAWAKQPFERGEMLWHGAAQRIVVLLQDGRYVTFDDAWREGMPVESCALTPPADRHLPVRGFGHLWCRYSELRDALGWATAPEAGFAGLYQVFAGGGILREPDGNVIALRNQGVWQKLKP